MIGVIVNPNSGYVTTHGVERIRALILDHIPDAAIRVLRERDTVEDVCEELLASGAQCVAAVGGDGTVNSVASLLVGSDIPLGVIPGGTLNHFARDVGVGRDVPNAIRILSAGFVMSVDVATVNDQIFLNNSSIGFYPQMVEIRERYEKRLGKWRAMARAAILVIRKAESITVDLKHEGRTERVRTYVLFVGNNQYELNFFRLGKRPCLDAGELMCFVLRSRNRARLFPLVFRFFRDSDSGGSPFHSLTVKELTVGLRGQRRALVSLDGEVQRLQPPLTYRVKPRALRVVVPMPPPVESREARSNADLPDLKPEN